MNLRELESVASAMTAPGKGILAADESSGTIKKRFDAVGVESTEDARRAYRGLLFTTVGLGELISGVILFDETLRQQTDDGVRFAEVLQRQGILPGIKVDKGAKALAGYPGETVTEGLDGLRERLGEYRGLGARFAKWRAVIHIGDGIPTPFGIEANAHALARYAMLCQEADLVPIVEPEVLMDGDHTLARCEEVTSLVLSSVFDQLIKHRLHLEGMVLKPNMVISGLACPQQASAEEIAEATVRCFRRHVPAAVPGIAFLSGGQSESQATANLNALNRIEGLPWQLSFSFGRALQQTVLATWGGQSANAAKAQEALLHRAHLNGLARRGTYESGLEKSGVPVTQA